MEESDTSLNVSEEIAVSIFIVRIMNVTPCSLPNYSTRIPEESLQKKKSKIVCVAISTALLPQ
jgi:hypothetical protein